MVVCSFYLGVLQSKLLQPWKQPPHTAKVILSKEARAVLNQAHSEKQSHFQNDIGQAWDMIEVATRTIAINNQKSIQCVQQELYLGCNSIHIQCTKPNAWNTFFWKKSITKAKENGMSAKKYIHHFYWLCIEAIDDEQHDNPEGDTIENGNKNKLIPGVSEREEYKVLSAKEKEVLLAEFTEFWQSKMWGLCTSACSKVNDVAQTLKAVKNEVFSLFIDFSEKLIWWTAQ